MRIHTALFLGLVVASGCTVAELPTAGGDVATTDTGTTADSGDTAAVEPHIVPSCDDATWTPGACAGAVETFAASVGATHIAEGEPVTYAANPPSSGDHRPTWAKWGEYDYLPPERWVHNLEHGGAAFLYHPCADAALVDALRAFAKARPADAGGVFRWVLTPHEDLPSAFAVVTWENVLSGECEKAIEDVGAFLDAHYRQAHEDIASDGPYITGWIGN